VGIEDRESWLLREHYPTGRASGGRRTGCLLMIAVPLVLVLVVLVASAALR